MKRILRTEIITRLSMIIHRAKVSAGFTNLSSLAFAAFDLVYCSLYVLRFVFVLDNTGAPNEDIVQNHLT